MPDASQGRADNRAVDVVEVTDRDYHDWLMLHARQLANRISRLKAERRARGGLPPRTNKLLLDSIDELARIVELKVQVEAGKTEMELRLEVTSGD